MTMIFWFDVYLKDRETGGRARRSTFKIKRNFPDLDILEHEVLCENCDEWFECVKVKLTEIVF